MWAKPERDEASSKGAWLKLDGVCTIVTRSISFSAQGLCDTLLTSENGVNADKKDIIDAV